MSQSIAETEEDLESTREAFLMFKDAYDIISDPVLRKAYDDFGHDGVDFVRHPPTEDKTLYNTLSSFLARGEHLAARDALEKAMRNHDYKKIKKLAPLHATIVLKCTTDHYAREMESKYNANLRLSRPTSFMQDPTLLLPNLEKSTITTEMEIPQLWENRWSIHVGGSTAFNAKSKKSTANGTVSLGCELAPGTELNSEVQFGAQNKLSITTNRVFSNLTSVTAGINIFQGLGSPSVSLSSQRALLRNKLHATSTLAIGTDGVLHFLSLGVTTLFQWMPRISLSYELGYEVLPLKLSLSHKDREHPDEPKKIMSLGWSPSKVEWTMWSQRNLSPFASMSLAVRHESVRGLMLKVEFTRGNVTFRVPIALSRQSMDSMYTFKAMYVGLLAYLVDETVAEVLQSSREKMSAQREATHAPSFSANVEAKSVRDHVQIQRGRLEQKQKTSLAAQVNFMTQHAVTVRKKEEEQNGLVIVKATYSCEAKNHQEVNMMDVTTQLQFWVKDSKLDLPAGSKTSLLGFHDITTATKRESMRGTVSHDNYNEMNKLRLWEAVRIMLAPVEEDPRMVEHTFLSIRYAFRGSVYDFRAGDQEAVYLPCNTALCLGIYGKVI